MRIAFDLTWGKQKNDGITRYAVEIMKRLSSGGGGNYSVEAFLGIKEKSEEMGEYFRSLVPDLPLKMRRLPVPMRYMRQVMSLRSPFSYDGLLKSDADVHVFFYNFVPRWRMKGKKVLVLHDLTPLHDETLPPKRRRRLQKQYRRVTERADLIFTDSEFSKRDILQYFPEAEKKLRVNYCGIDYERFSAPVSEEKLAAVREKYGLGESWLLFVGQARTNKNLENLMRGFARLPEVVRGRYPLVLANHTPALKALAEELGIERETVLLHGIDEEDVTAVYHGARALALVSTSEGFGLPLVEAMAAGIPTVTSDASCLPEVAGDASCYADPLSPDSIGKALERVLYDEELRSVLIWRGRARAQLYSWDIAARNFYEEIEKLVKKD